MKTHTTICAIAAVGPDNVIGLNGKMPWYSKQDFYHFRHITYGFPCVFGKNTYENMPKKPLPGRINIVCSSAYNNECILPNYYHAQNIESAIKQCFGYDKMFICGGALVYKYAFDNDLIDVMYLTIINDDILANKIKKNPDCYTRFPKNIHEFFDLTKWRGEKIVYPNNFMNSDTNQKLDFYRFNRVR